MRGERSPCEPTPSLSPVRVSECRTRLLENLRDESVSVKAYQQRWTGPSVVLLILLATGCARPVAVDDLTMRDSNQNHWEIASLYTRQAAVFREKAEEQLNRIEVYKKLFGPDSEWVSGARLLAEFYQQQAQDWEKQAEIQLNLAKRRGQSSAEGSTQSLPRQ